MSRADLVLDHLATRSSRTGSSERRTASQSSEQFRVVIVDDERLARERLAGLLAREADTEVVGQCANGVEALQLIARAPSGQRPDVVLLDVQMPDLDGIGVAERLLEMANESEMPELIFVTAYGDYMERAFELHAIDYLRKPYTDSRFRSALDHARRRVVARRAAAHRQDLEQRPYSERGGISVPIDGLAELRRLLKTLNGGREQDRVAIRDRATGAVRLIEARHIVWIAAHGAGQVELHIDTGPMIWHRGIETVDSELASLGFLRVHRSTLINPAHLVSAKPLTKGQYMLTMSDGAQFDTGRAFASKLEAHLSSIPGGR
jgi:two-component system LytT family response regulator